MAVYHYRASVREREEHSESGTVVARNEQEAKRKLEALQFNAIRLKQIKGFSSFLKRFTADVR